MPLFNGKVGKFRRFGHVVLAFTRFTFVVRKRSVRFAGFFGSGYKLSEIVVLSGNGFTFGLIALGALSRSDSLFRTGRFLCYRPLAVNVSVIFVFTAAFAS